MCLVALLCWFGLCLCSYCFPDFILLIIRVSISISLGPRGQQGCHWFSPLNSCLACSLGSSLLSFPPSVQGRGHWLMQRTLCVSDSCLSNFHSNAVFILTSFSLSLCKFLVQTLIGVRALWVLAAAVYHCNYLMTGQEDTSFTVLFMFLSLWIHHQNFTFTYTSALLPEQRWKVK